MSDSKPADTRDRFIWQPDDLVFEDEDGGREAPEEKALREALSQAQIDAGNYKKRHLKFQGMDVSIENEAGSVRSGQGKDGHKWQTQMCNHYGYIRRTEGPDGDHVDVYLGPNEDAPYAYVVHQMKPSTGEYDEDKCMLGFDSEAEAKAAYLKHYDDPRFLGAITIVPMSLFKERVYGSKGESVVPDGPERAKNGFHHKSLFSEEWV